MEPPRRRRLLKALVEGTPSLLVRLLRGLASPPPSWTWLAAFLPALAYLLQTRLRSYTAWGGNVGRPVGLSEDGSDSIRSARLVVFPREGQAEPPGAGCDELAKVFYLSPDAVLSCRQQHHLLDGSSRASTTRVSLPLGEDAGKGSPGKNGLMRVVGGSGGHLHGVVDSAWRHDADLGRGYVLLSDSHGDGRVWRWEVGGGPIAIGKTLHLDRAGCRSGLHRPCLRPLDKSQQSSPSAGEGAAPTPTPLGSGGLAIDFGGKDRPDEGRLVVAEWGEGRIARLEQNGARTPLVIEVPHLCAAVRDNKSCSGGGGDDACAVSSVESVVRVQRPTQLLYLAAPSSSASRGGAADLVFVDHHPACGLSGLFWLKNASGAEPLPNLAESRAAHAWTALERRSPPGLPEIVPLSAGGVAGVRSIGGLAVTEDSAGLYVVARLADGNGGEGGGRMVLLRKDLYGEEDDDEEDDEEEDDDDVSEAPSKKTGRRASEAASAKTSSATSAVAVDLTPYVASAEEKPGSVAVSKDFVFVTVDDGVLVVEAASAGSAPQRVLGKLELQFAEGPPPPPLPLSLTSITLGEDGFLYLTTRDQLLRIRVRTRPVRHPTRRVRK